ncbi:piwi-like protein Ago3 [Chrysoperla carnea]|uniref:piwi-like protein Ago3 n=1 Tax=Chrysoperla carnea TaxID=189513 RepID=UPI001D089E41|nr:piwi-like protein Ago3 [Chrysoperla carnea]
MSEKKCSSAGLPKLIDKKEDDPNATPSLYRIGRGRGSGFKSLAQLRDALNSSTTSNTLSESTTEHLKKLGSPKLCDKLTPTTNPKTETEATNPETQSFATTSNTLSESTTKLLKKLGSPKIDDKSTTFTNPETDTKNSETVIKRETSIKSDITVASTANVVVSTKETTPVIKRATPTESDKIVTSTANYIRLNVDPEKGVYEYDVRFNPSVDNRNLKLQILEKFFISPLKISDGNVFYLPIRLNITNFSGKHPVNGVPITINMTLRRKLSLAECTPLYNILFRRIFKLLQYVQFGRKMFNPAEFHRLNQHKLEIWPGYVTAVDEYEDGIMLCIDCSHRVLRTDTVRSYLVECISVAHRTGRSFKQEAEKALIGQDIITRYNNKIYCVDDILWDQNPSGKFQTRDGSEISYIEYFKNYHGIEIQDVKQPLLVHKRPNDTLLCLIPELSHMTGLTEQMKKDFVLMRDLNAVMQITPDVRKMAIQKFLNSVRNNSEAQKLLNLWGLSLESKTINLEMRILPAENILFGGSKCVQGSWNADWCRSIRENRLISAIDIQKWYVIFTPGDRIKAESFTDMLLQVCDPMGMRICPPQLICLQNDATETYVQMLNEIIQPDVQIIVLLCPRIRDDRYSAIKKICCVDKPIPSQVIQSRTIKSNLKQLRPVVRNIALKMNCKLGGQLWSINFPKHNWMICGIDVYHDNRSRSRKSVVGFVASMNQQITRWFSQVAFQTKTEELCSALKALFTNALKNFFNVNGNWPTQIFIFRDGISDGQLKFSKQYEIPQLMEALKIIWNSNICRPDQMPKLTFIVVQKRINTRLFLQDNEKNPPPGSIIDHTITRRDWYDFFLIPQCTRQGTVSVTHYVVIEDQSGMSVAHIQQLAFKMCHMYYNWSGTISVPAPCQYAHRLASLVGTYIHKIPDEKLANRLYYI